MTINHIHTYNFCRKSTFITVAMVQNFELMYDIFNIVCIVSSSSSYYLFCFLHEMGTEHYRKQSKHYESEILLKIKIIYKLEVGGYYIRRASVIYTAHLVLLW